MTEQLWGGETTKAVDNFPVSGERVPVPVVRWLGRVKAAAAEVNGELGLLDGDLAERIAEAGRRRRRGRARRPVPGRRLPDRLRHLLEHERQRGARQPRRRGRPPQRPRQHGPVLQRRLPLRRAPGGAGRGDPRPAAGDGRAGVGAGGEGEAFRRRRQGRPHPPDGRRAGHPRPGVRRLRGAGPARDPAGRGDAAPGRPDPARRHRHRHRAQHPPRVRRQGAREARRRHRPGDLRAARPLRGAGQPRRAGRALRGAQGLRRLAQQDRQRPGADGLRPARRPRRAAPAGAAEGLLDHARQGQPGDPGGGDPGRRPGDRQRRRDHRSPAARASSSSTCGCR